MVFLRGASITSQLLGSTFDWYSALNNNQSVDVIYSDLSKAFDKVSHSKLLLRLRHIGVDGTLLNWLKSYLSNRHMWVRVNNDFSKCYPCSSGVPQGGVLSPILFVIYCVDLPEKLKTHTSVRIQLYADDIKVYGIYGKDNRHEIHKALSDSIWRLMEWTEMWELPVNLSKTYGVHFGRDQGMQYGYKDIVFKHCEEVKDLGVHISNSLDFRPHVESITRKALRSVFFIFRNIHSNDISIFLRLYNAYVLPQLEYFCQVWNPCGNKRLQSQIEKVQRTFTRILMYRTFNLRYPNSPTSYSSRLQIFGLKSLLFRRVFSDLVLCFRILHMEVNK